jgi:hypothetical protein
VSGVLARLAQHTAQMTIQKATSFGYDFNRVCY